MRRDAIAALFGFCICLLIWLELASLLDRDRDWVLIATGAAGMFGAGAWAWLHATWWSRAAAIHQLRVFRGWLISGIMHFPIRRVPGSEREKPMERNEAEVAKVIAEAAKLVAEAGRANAQARWYPVIVIGGVFAAAIILVKFVL